MSIQQEFIDLIALGAQECQYMSGMFASVTLAQSCLETGYGAAHPIDVNTGEDSFNVFGIKAVNGRPFVTAKTWEEVTSLPTNYLQYEKLATGKFRVQILADFIKFSSVEECVLYRSKFLIESSYYGKALQSSTPEDAIYYLVHTGFFNGRGEEIGYATDSEYVSKIISIINRFDLKKYDLRQEDFDMIAELKSAVDELLTRVDAQEKKIAELSVSAYTIKPANEQKLEAWAKEGYDFVVAHKISDGTRPESPVSRQEVWAMEQRYNANVPKK